MVLLDWLDWENANLRIKGGGGGGVGKGGQNRKRKPTSGIREKMSRDL